MSQPSEIPAATDNTIANANQAAEKPQESMTPEQQAALSLFAKKMLHAMTRHNTPFDGRKRARRVAKLKASRKASKRARMAAAHRRRGK
jgi:hypothetical protein